MVQPAAKPKMVPPKDKTLPAKVLPEPQRIMFPFSSRNTSGENLGHGQTADDGNEDSDIWNPSPLFVGVDGVVTEEGDQDQTTGPRRQNTAVDDMQELSRRHDVDSTPTDTGDGVDESEDSHTDVTDQVSGQDHLSETKLGTENGEERNWQGTQDVEKENAQDRGTEVQAEH